MVLKIDVDRQRKLSRRELERRARIAHVTIVRLIDTRSPSGRGWHRVMEMERSDGGENGRQQRTRGVDTSGTMTSQRTYSPSFSALEVVALQLLFGSDPIREAFNLHRARLVDAKQVSPFWRRRFNTLYETSGGKTWRERSGHRKSS